MELYDADEGDANNGKAVFRSTGICDAYEKSVIILKGKMFYNESEWNASFKVCVVEFMKEIGLNEMRFIRYLRKDIRTRFFFQIMIILVKCL